MTYKKQTTAYPTIAKMRQIIRAEKLTKLRAAIRNQRLGERAERQKMNYQLYRMRKGLRK